MSVLTLAQHLWGAPEDAEGSKRPSRLIYGIENEIKDYNISRSVDKNAFALVELLTEGLLFQRPDGSLTYDLVRQEQRQGKLWTLHFRESRFSTGKSVECSDIQANLEEARKSPRPVRARLKDIESTWCEGAALKIRTTDIAPQLLNRIGHIIRIYDPKTIGEKIPVGSGPYVIAGKEKNDLVLRPNSFFPRPSSYQEIRFRTLRDSWLRDLALFSGNVDFLLENFSLLRLKAYEAKSREGIQLFQGPSPLLYHIAFNAARVPLETRKEIQRIVESKDLVSSFWAGHARRSAGIFSVESPERQKTVDAPIPQKILTLELKVVSDETQLRFLRNLAKEFLKQGIRISLRPLEFATFMKSLNSQNFEAYFFHVDTSHVLNLEALFSTTRSRLGIRDPALAQLFSRYARTESKSELSILQDSLDKAISDSAYLVPVYRPVRELAASPRIRLKPGKDGFWRDLLLSRKQ